MTEDSKDRLGRGLSALLGDDAEDYMELDEARAYRSVPVEHLTPGRYQPRQRFDEADMDALVGSIREKGILQPIVVRRRADAVDRYEIVAGERRWRAAQQVSLHEVPIIIRDLTDRDALEIALVENLQRESLTAVEEATAYQRLMEEFSHTQEALAKAVGKSRSHIANTLRLLNLPGTVMAMLDAGQLSAGHARALINAEDPVALAEQIVAKGLNVRQAEALAQSAKPNTARRKRNEPKDSDTLALERDLSNLLGLKVSIKFCNGGGSLTIAYQTLEQLDDVLQRLNQGGPVNRDDDDSDDAADADYSERETFSPIGETGSVDIPAVPLERES